MLRSVDPSGELLMAQLDRMDARLSKAQQEMSSGLKLREASDSPDVVSDVLQLRAEIARNKQINTNLGLAKAQVDSSDAALQHAVQIMDQAVSAGMQGAGIMVDDSARHTLAEQVRGDLAAMVGVSQTAVEGRYVFGGDLDTIAPYVLNVAGNAAVLQQGASATRKLEHPTGEGFSISKSAMEIFDVRDGLGDPASGNVFNSLSNLAAALDNGDTDWIGQALTGVRQASTHLNDQLGFYGGVQNRIAEAETASASLDTRLRTTLSGRQDADMTASILELQQVQLNRGAALQARATVKSLSLFDYLK
jgi:flagellar hook-associated protein 3 FlgL